MILRPDLLLILARKPSLRFLFRVFGWYVLPLFPPLVPHLLWMTFVSGDVHVGGLGRLYSHPKMDLRKDFRFMPQVCKPAHLALSPAACNFKGPLFAKRKVWGLVKQDEKKIQGAWQEQINGRGQVTTEVLEEWVGFAGGVFSNNECSASRRSSLNLAYLL